MAAEGGKGAEERIAKLGKDVIWLRVALILVLVVLGLVAVALLQMRTTMSALTTTAEAAKASAGVSASRFVVVERMDSKSDKGKEVEKSRVRAELSVKNGVARLELFDEAGKMIWSTPVPASAEEPSSKEGPATKAPEKEKEK